MIEKTKILLLTVIAICLIMLNMEVRRANTPKPKHPIVEVVGYFEARIPYPTGGDRNRYLVRESDGAVRAIDMPYHMDPEVKFLADVGNGKYVAWAIAPTAK